MKILVTNGQLAGLGGSETAAYTLAMELIRRGHQVSVFALSGSKRFASRLPMVKAPARSYDLMLISHNTSLEALKDVEGRKVFICHGTLPKVEQPKRGAHVYVAVSEEVRDHCQGLGYDAQVIRNGVDCNRFRPNRAYAIEATKVLALCRGGAALKKVEGACRIAGLECRAVNDEWDVERHMQWADIVVSYGRGAMEAMACGRAVVVYDERTYYAPADRVGDGMVMDGVVGMIRQTNFSGRCFRLPLDAAALVAEFARYEPEMGPLNRAYALRHFNIRRQAAKYLALAEEPA